ncbi:Very-long-chain aldehyde decarbonylase GL1-9 [Citrus sinensis]|nr:Very-long-chain aldehyde decarbonylase GL1-9 [Citrus sinensis]
MSPDHHRTSPECHRTTIGSRRKVAEIPSASPEGRRTFAGIHRKHHRLVVPYAIGALYNHPLEGLLLDTLGGALYFLVSGMTARTTVIFFCFAVIKTVDDHSRLWLPVNIFHLFFQNNTAYHDVHHQLQGLKYNYSQSFFSIWDRLLGTHMPYHPVKLPEGGFEAQLKKD